MITALTVEGKLYFFYFNDAAGRVIDDIVKKLHLLAKLIL